MGSRMDKYNNNNSDIPKRSEKNKEIYRQIYNAYDEFENLVVPSNVKEIDISNLKMEITSRDEYKKVKEYTDITNNKVIRKERVIEKQKKENEIYDINELLNKAVKDKKQDSVMENTITSENYLKRLKLDDTRTNLDIVKEMYEDIKKETEDESEELLKTAELSLDLLADLRGENEDTMIQAPIKDEYMPDSDKKFYSSEFKFSKNDFEDKKIEDNIEFELDEDKIKGKNNDIDDDKNEENEEDFYDDEMSDGNGRFFFKILLLIFGLALVVVVAIYLLNYFNRI